MTTVNAKLVHESRTTTDWSTDVPTAGRFVVELDDGDGVTPVGLYYANGTDDIGSLTNLMAGDSGASGATLAEKVYNPGSQATPSTTSTSYADVDATNLVIPDFTVPASGKVRVTLQAVVAGTSSEYMLWNLRDGSGNIAGTGGIVTRIAGASDVEIQTRTILVDGLTPDATITGWKWGFRSLSGNSVQLNIGGGDNLYPPALITVEDRANPT